MAVKSNRPPIYFLRTLVILDGEEEREIVFGPAAQLLPLSLEEVEIVAYDPVNMLEDGPYDMESFDIEDGAEVLEIVYDMFFTDGEKAFEQTFKHEFKEGGAKIEEMTLIANEGNLIDKFEIDPRSRRATLDDCPVLQFIA
jgi:hypothetical protein